MMKRIFFAAVCGALVFWMAINRLLHRHLGESQAASEFLEVARRQAQALTLLNEKLDRLNGTVIEEARATGTAVAVATPGVQRTVPMSLVLPCDSDDFRFLPVLMESLSKQTVFPQETLLILNLRDGHLDGIDLTELSHPNIVRKEAERMRASIPGNATADPSVAYRRVMASTQVMEKSLAGIPNIKIILRGTTHYAGSNRMYGYNKSNKSNDIVSFFDCDDYMHPQRTEFVNEIFLQHPELHAAIHGFKMIKFSEWDDQLREFVKPVEPPLAERFEFPLGYDFLRERVPDIGNKTWDINDWTSEPNWRFANGETSKTWWFPVGMKLPRIPPFKIQPHNGWVTVRRGVPERVPYPQDLRRGQDSLYNFRLLKSGVNFNYIPYLLGGYVRKS